MENWSRMKDIASKILFVFVIVVLLSASAARADIFLWQDPDFKYQISYPDTWYRQAPDTPATRLLVAAPHDRASCRVRAETDRRTMIYPKHLMKAAVNDQLNQAYWWEDVAQYDNAQLLDMYQSAGIGQGNATYVVAGYTIPDGAGNNVQMQTIMFSTLYGDMRYTVNCAAEAGKFIEWQPLFMSVMGSSTFDPHYMAYPHGLYWRDYSKDKQLILRQGGPGTVRVSWGPFEWFRYTFFQ